MCLLGVVRAHAPRRVDLCRPGLSAQKVRPGDLYAWVWLPNASANAEVIGWLPDSTLRVDLPVELPIDAGRVGIECQARGGGGTGRRRGLKIP